MRELFKKDIKLLFANKKTMVTFILMPIILTGILSMALRGSFDTGSFKNRIDVAIVKGYDIEVENARIRETLGQYGIVPEPGDEPVDPEKLFFDTFLGSEGIKKVLEIHVMTEAEAMSALEAKEVGVVLTLPEGFVYNQVVNFVLPVRNDIEIELLQHPEFNFSGNIATSIFEGFFTEINTYFVNKNVFLEVGSNYTELANLFPELERVYAFDSAETSALSVAVEEGRRPIDSATYYAVAMTSMFILYGSALAGRELLSEKKTRTLDRNYVAGIGYTKALVSKGLMAVILCTFQMAVLLSVSKLAFGVDWQRFDQLFVSIVFSSIAIAGLGAFLSAITLINDNYRVANIFENVVVQFMALVGGAYIPMEVLPGIFQHLRIFALNSIVLDVLLDIYQGTTWEALAGNYLKLVGAGGIFLMLAYILVRRKEKAAYVGDA
ncbi:ABC transporter permease [Fusibacter sp. JL298sf-3]